MAHSKSYLAACISLSLILCVAQISGSMVLILACLFVFMILLGWACVRNYTLPMLLFFLPWSQLMRLDSESFSFFTFGLVMVCFVSILKKRFNFRRYHIVAGIVIAFLTLFSKLWDGSWITFDYIAFIMLIFLFPVVKEEHIAKKYDFFHVVLFLSTGVVLAALCAQWFASYPNISEYITVHSYLTIVRMCGFYGDPNFYSAQITAALSGCLYVILNEINRRRIGIMGILIPLLIYCGTMSGSKSFVLVTAVMIFLWAVATMRMKGKLGRKIILIAFGIIVAVYIASSALFGGWIDIIATRFSFSKNLSDLTTGRTELWQLYLEEIFHHGKILFLGKGFTNIKLNDRSSHNTILQAIFQFGLIGSTVLMTWIVCFFKNGQKKIGKSKFGFSLCILLAGVFLPWLAIDALFFDEFFLFQWYVFMAVYYSGDYKNQQDCAAGSERVKKCSHIRILWR